MLKRHRPSTTATRGRISVRRRGTSKNNPQKSLTSHLKRQFGRGRGKVSTRHKGGGHKRLFREIDFKQLRMDEPAKIIKIEYDPNRTAFIALIEYPGGRRSYIIAYKGAKEGHEVIAGEKVPRRLGNRTRLKNLPLGTEIYNIELKPGRGGILCRSAGSRATVLSKEGKLVTLRMPSKERRLVLAECFASIGQVSNLDHAAIRFSKAGNKRHLGIRPTVRGVAMSPKSHPHGGGEGRSGIGMSTPKTVYGKPARGVKTRYGHKYSNKFILKRRSKGKKRK